MKKNLMERVGQNKGKLIGYLIFGIIGVCIVIIAFSVFAEAESYKGNSLNWHTGVTTKESRETLEKWGIGIFIFGAIVIAEACSKCYGILFKDKSKDKEKNVKPKVDTSYKLRELKKMLDENIITKEEYEEKKKDFLNKM